MGQAGSVLPIRPAFHSTGPGKGSSLFTLARNVVGGPTLCQ